MRILSAFLAATAAVLCAIPGPARADDLNTGPDTDLGGTAATDGLSAFNGVNARAQKVHLSMACGNELSFMQRFIHASRFGKGDNADEQWPEDLLVGKGALLNDPAFQMPQPGSDRGAPRCVSDLGLALGSPDTYGVASTWAPLTKDGKQHNGENAADVVNRVYQDWFNTADGSQSAACDHVADMVPTGPAVRVAYQPNDMVVVRLTPACIARQIRVVMTDPGNGPWRNGPDGAIAELPGTDPSSLPCLSEWKIGIKGVTGDWDMAVTDYTRLSHLLYRVGKVESGMDRDIAAALDILNRRFLTLRSSPGDATAREEFNLATSCGNTGNKFGSASDTMTGSGTDPGVGRYSSDGKDAVDGSSFWDSLLHFLAILALVVAAVVVAAVAGVIVATVLGIGAIGAGAAIATGVVAVLLLATLFLGSIPETENHLLMQNVGRYLKNKLMMAELSQQGKHDQFDELVDLNEDVRTWLLEDMQRIAEDDFLEYNAKPYTRMSVFALLNLIDYACDVRWDYTLSAQMENAHAPCDPKDRAIVDAAAAVLDLSAAKAAVGSLDGRRMIPFRRRAEKNRLYYDSGNPVAAKEIANMGGDGTDSMLAALQVWTGQMRFAPTGKANLGTFGNLAFYSSSNYRPDPMILDIAVDKSTPRWQQYRHHTQEAYSSGDGWLITAGGTDEGAAQGLDYWPGITIYPPFGEAADVRHSQRGVGVPTTLMTDAATAQPGYPHSRVSDFLRFDGKLVQWDDKDKPVSYSDNNCVTMGFACGLNPRTPLGYDKKTCETPISDKFVAIDSTLCPAIGAPADPKRGIYIAYYDHDGQWGFFEVASRSQFNSVQDFVNKVRERNSANLNNWAGKGAGDEIRYIKTDGTELNFTPAKEDFDQDERACGIVNHESGSRFTISNVPAAQAGSCLSVGRRIFIDLNDAENPVRKAENGAPLPPLY